MAEEAILQTVRTQNQPSADHDAFAQTLKTSLRTAKAHAARARRTDIGLFVVVIIAPAVATFIAALAAVAGGNDLFPFITGVDDGGWKLACALAAGFSFIAALGSAFKERVDKHVESEQGVRGPFAGAGRGAADRPLEPGGSDEGVCGSAEGSRGVCGVIYPHPTLRVPSPAKHTGHTLAPTAWAQCGVRCSAPVHLPVRERARVRSGGGIHPQ